MSYSFEREVFEKKIGNSLFYVLETRLDHIGEIISQEYISTVKNGFTLSFIITYSTEEEKNELYEVINNVKI
jgi:hypothetical protein